MIGYFHISEGTDPYVNLATEEYLLGSDAPVLYFWQNEPTVVIGRNQNAYTECAMDYVRANGIHVARRTTGGGAVYHDLGNLNFSIVLPKPLHDIARSTGVIVKALRGLGVPVSASGRNDILLDGRKISGNAYYSNDVVGLHHGTILHKVDGDAVGGALAVSANKRSRHGVDSVRSRVTDISSHVPGVTVAAIEDAVREAFCAEYGIDTLRPPAINGDALGPLVARHACDEWVFGRINEFDEFREANFPWGTIRVSVRFLGDVPQDCEIASDSLEPDLIDEARRMLNARGAADSAHSPIVDDILDVYGDILSGKTDTASGSK